MASPDTEQNAAFFFNKRATDSSSSPPIFQVKPKPLSTTPDLPLSSRTSLV
jgi:hypothetical protein